MEELGWDRGLPVCAPRRDETEPPVAAESGCSRWPWSRLSESRMRLCVHRWNYVKMKMKL